VVELTQDADPAEEIHGRDLHSFCSIPRTREEIANYLGISVSNYMMKKYVTPLLENGTLRMTYPEKPRSKKQTYVITAIE
ncbi:MAG: AAA family ATPase, partial [Clostridia bacterium]|nr:AAA family ATPase [Clostridia bacterium]